MTLAPDRLHRGRTTIEPLTDQAEALIPEARRRQRQRRLLLSIVISALVAVAVGLYAAMSSGGGSLTVRGIEARVAGSVSRSGSLVLRAEVTSYPVQGPDGQLGTSPYTGTTWIDLRTGKSRSVTFDSGQLNTMQETHYTSTAAAQRLTLRRLTVSYETDSWSNEALKWPWTHMTPERVCNCDPLVGHGYSHDTILGHRTIAGQPTIEIQLSNPASFLYPPASTLDVWVSTSSYLPVREITNTSGHPMVIRSFSWLPRTRANLAHLNAPVRIPPTFNRVPVA